MSYNNFITSHILIFFLKDVRPIMPNVTHRHAMHVTLRFYWCLAFVYFAKRAFLNMNMHTIITIRRDQFYEEFLLYEMEFNHYQL